MKNKIKAFFYAFRGFFIVATTLLFVFIYMKLFCTLAGYSSIVSGIASDSVLGIVLCALMLAGVTIYVLYLFICYVLDCWDFYKGKLEELNNHE